MLEFILLSQIIRWININLSNGIWSYGTGMGTCLCLGYKLKAFLSVFHSLQERVSASSKVNLEWWQAILWDYNQNLFSGMTYFYQSYMNHDSLSMRHHHLVYLWKIWWSAAAVLHLFSYIQLIASQIYYVHWFMKAFPTLLPCSNSGINIFTAFILCFDWASTSLLISEMLDWMSIS